MKNFLVEIKPTAEQDLTQRYEQTAEESPQNALNWYLRMIIVIEKLNLLAERCPLAPEGRDLNLGIRHLVIGDTEPFTSSTMKSLKFCIYAIRE